MVQHQIFYDDDDKPCNDAVAAQSRIRTGVAIVREEPVASTSTAILSVTGNGHAGDDVVANDFTDVKPPVFKKKRRRDSKPSAEEAQIATSAKADVATTNGHARSMPNGTYSARNGPSTVHFNDDDDSDSDPDRDTAVLTNGHAPRPSGKSQADQAQRRAKAAHLLDSRQKLPVWHAKEAILKEIEQLDTVIVLGETGSGKTTQIPQFLLDSCICRPKPKIVVTQPRRVAATSLARRVAEEVGCQLGGAVGYTVRFDDRSSQATRLKYVTDGTLLQEILGDPLLDSYDIVVIDEAHERSLRTDMILGFLKQIQAKRKQRPPVTANDSQKALGPLKIIVMSATLDAQRFSEFYDNAKVLYVKGREHKVKILYLEQAPNDYLEAATKAIFQLHVKSPPGDVLVFLSGQEDIETLRAQLESYIPSMDKTRQTMLICLLYARLTPGEQDKAFNVAPPNTRKIILATNVAETSITISGITYVIDCGLAKEKSYHPVTGMESLLLSPISRSSAVQRAGRAGRESAGICYRLYTEIDYHKLRQTALPEIKRCSLAFVLLHLKAAGQDDVFNFPYMDRPDHSAIITSLSELNDLGAINDAGSITASGRQMAQLPLEPRQSKCLLASLKHGCPMEMVDLLALLASAEQLLTVARNQRETAAEARSKFIHRSGDHMMLLNILHAYEDASASLKSKSERKAWCSDHFLSLKTLNQVLDARKQLRDRMDRMKLDWRASAKDEDQPVLLSLLEGLRCNTAMRMQDGSYRRNDSNMRVKVHPSSIMHGRRTQAIVFSELLFTNSIYGKIVSSISPVWLRPPAHVR